MFLTDLTDCLTGSNAGLSVTKSSNCEELSHVLTDLTDLLLIQHTRAHECLYAPKACQACQCVSGKGAPNRKAPNRKVQFNPEQLAQQSAADAVGPRNAARAAGPATLNAAGGSAKQQSAGCLSRSTPADAATSARCFPTVRADFWQERSVRAQPAHVIPRTYRRPPTRCVFASEQGR